MVQQNSASESTINKSENTHDPKKQVMTEYEFLERMFDATGRQISEYDPNSKEAVIIRHCLETIKTQVEQMDKIEAVADMNAREEQRRREAKEDEDAETKYQEQRNKASNEFNSVDAMWRFGDE